MGNRTIQFIAADNKRRSVRLGKVTMKTAREVKTKVESLNAALCARISIDPETAQWLGEIGPKLYNRIAAAGLAMKRKTEHESALGPFIDAYLATRHDIKPRTRINLNQVRRDLIEFFGASKLLADVSEGDADEWRLWLRKRLNDNSTRRHCSRARQLFRAAMKRRIIRSNPFAEMKGLAVQSNEERLYFVSRQDAELVLTACTDAEFRLIFALARYGGLRTPSETLALRWGDIDWERSRMRVASPKTEHIEGKAWRYVPLFPELLPHLQAVFEEVEGREDWSLRPDRPMSAEPVVSRYRDGNVNLRTRLMKTIRRAGIEPWPKLFQNLRSTRQTELAEEYPAHVVCTWIGNTEAVAKKHYLQVTEEHFKKATEKPVQKPVQSATVNVGKDVSAKEATLKTTESYKPLSINTLDQYPHGESNPGFRAENPTS